MSLEDLTGLDKFLDALIPTNPVGAADAKAQGDDHIRGIKNVILNTFPNINAAVTTTPAELNSLDGVTALAQSILLAATAGDIQTLIGISAFVKTLLDDADAAAFRTTLGLGSAAVKNAGSATGEVVLIEDVGGSAALPALDGSQLTGVLSSATVGSLIVASADTERLTLLTAYTKVKEIQMGDRGGTFTVSFDHGIITSLAYDAYAQIWVNGSPVGVESVLAGPATTYVSRSESIDLGPQDKVQLYIKSETSSVICKVRNFRVKEANPFNPYVLTD